MTQLILRIYSYMKVHRMTALLSFLLLTALLVLSVFRLSYKEDIADFLPLDDNRHNALQVYQDIAGANKIFAVFQYRDSTKADPDMMVAAIENYVATLSSRDSTGIARELTAQVDIEKLTDITDFVYSNIPYFLTPADYRRIDSLISTPGYVRRQLQQAKQMLMFPSGGILADNIQRDPLNLFTPVVEQLQHTDSGLKYEMYDGYIFSPDMQRAIVMVNSPFGASETEHNTALLSLLRSSADSTTAHCANIDIHIIGGPVIAVGNASQIKTDSILSVSLAVALIIALLFLSFRSWKNLLLIAVSIAWGWLFAMGCLALVHDSVSIIVIGISSVIVGIAVNYPLHFIAHLSHTPDKKKALKEIVMPLVVGNITTVGAFLALVPLQSVAMRDLGLFASFLLIGTILFVLLFLPQVTTVRQQEEKSFFSKLGDVSLENKPVVVAIVGVLTLVFAYYSFSTAFDANMGHINYMTDEQKADMAYFQKMMTNAGDDQKVYAVSSDSTLDGALDKSGKMQRCYADLQRRGLVKRHAGLKQFVSSEAEQRQRLAMWRDFVARHRAPLLSALASEGAGEGFSRESFDGFAELLGGTYEAKPVSYFNPLTKTAFASNISCDSVGGCYSVVDVLSVKPGDVETVENAVNKSGAYGFDVLSMNSAIANNLSNDFNYIGWACGCIVFFFLWMSLGSIELAILSFVPMAVSWVWILGIMSLFGIQFNIVNIILATFIFGQGDDYTIFMTEGACYEYAYRRKMLASYKNSIIISALIMFIGIGTLIVAKHPALHSLAQVTIAGMFSVVLMAYLFPPLIFNFLVRGKRGYRVRPVVLMPLLAMAWSALVFLLQLLTVYAYGFCLFVLTRKTERKTLLFRRYIRRLYMFDLRHIPGVSLHVDNPLGDEAFSKPSVVVCNHQSMLDAAVFMALNERLILVSNGNPSSNVLVKKIFRWMEYISLVDGNGQQDATVLSKYVDRGYSFVVFPEGERNDSSSILRFHKGAFYLAEKLRLDVLPVFLHGFNFVLPRGSLCVYPGTLSVFVRQILRHDDAEWGADYAERTKRVHDYYVSEYRRIASSIETADYYAPLVIDRYRYKGVEIFSDVVRGFKRNANYRSQLKLYAHKPVIRLASGTCSASPAVASSGSYGEFALLCALVYPEAKVMVGESDVEKANVLRYCAEGLVDNLEIGDMRNLSSITYANTQNQ